MKIFVLSRCAWTLANFRLGLIKAMAAAGHQVTAAGAGGDGYEPKILEAGVPFEALPVDKRGINPVADLRLLYVLWRWYRKEKPDAVVHFTIKPVIYASLAARLAGVPRIINVVNGLGYAFSEDRAWWLRAAVHFLYRLAGWCGHFTYFQNTDDRQYFIDHNLVRPEKTEVLPGSGVNCDWFSPQPPFEGPPTALMVARLLTEKGVYEFVEAARLVKKEIPDARFLLLGPRDERNPTVIPQQDLDDWQAAGLVEWTDQVSDVRPFVARSSVVVLPSYYREGVPRSLLEAAAMSRPVVTTDSVGCRETVKDGETGLLVPPRDALALARAIQTILSDPGLAQGMGAAGRQRVEKEFNEKEVIRRIMEKVQAL